MEKINCGLFWHLKHDELFGVTFDADKRRRQIRQQKPAMEVEIRLRLMQPVRGRLGDPGAMASYIEARAAYFEVSRACADAGAAYDNMVGSSCKKAAQCAERDSLRDSFYDLGIASQKAAIAYDNARLLFFSTIELNEAEALHALECPDCPWDGTTIFPDGWSARLQLCGSPEAG